MTAAAISDRAYQGVLQQGIGPPFPPPPPPPPPLLLLPSLLRAQWLYRRGGVVRSQPGAVEGRGGERRGEEGREEGGADSA